jgi:hypothetical protein
MLERILRLLGRATIDLDAPARALADQVFDEFDEVTGLLDPFQTRQLLKTRYMRMVAKYGLPASACDDVAERAWKLVAQAQEVQPDGIPSFTFYD